MSTSNFKIHTSKQLSASSAYLCCLNKGERKTFAALAKHANLRNDVHCFIKQCTLAEKVSLSLRTVKSHIKKFFELGLITKIKSWSWDKKRENTKQNPNKYIFNIDRIIELISTKETFRKERVTTKICTFSALSDCTHKDLSLTDTSLTNTKDQKKDLTNVDSDSFCFEKDKKNISDMIQQDRKDANQLLSQLLNAKKYSNKATAWLWRGRRYYNNADGGMYIHKSYAGNPRGLLGFVHKSPAAELVHDTIIEIQAYLVNLNSIDDSNSCDRVTMMF
ncbi:helix-turn-helix domain-containing protein (plasmid) [Photobacterium leiognathi subsp. mandapamensis]|uniref:helix-turn-helix domain-containing protein n=1 Tax=Photobacterium leiognathi TaxID=553611 RepID=UPI003AF332BA